MKVLLFISFFALFFVVCLGADQSSCLSSCTVVDGTCCGCCESTQTCHQIPELAVCCGPDQAFCGCQSYRAYCAGYIWDYTSSFNTFGVCYNVSEYAACAYEPTPNWWTLCPNDAKVPCYNFDQNYNAPAVCCTPDDLCIYNATSFSNQCVPPVTCGGAQCLQGNECCLDKATGHRCYNTTTTTCSSNPAGGYSLCPFGDQACGAACYNSAEYCCDVNNDLRQIQFC